MSPEKNFLKSEFGQPFLLFSSLSNVMHTIWEIGQNVNLSDKAPFLIWKNEKNICRLNFFQIFRKRPWPIMTKFKCCCLSRGPENKNSEYSIFRGRTGRGFVNNPSNFILYLYPSPQNWRVKFSLWFSSKHFLLAHACNLFYLTCPLFSQNFCHEHLWW